MRLTVATSEGVLHIEFEPAAKDGEPQRETSLDALVERGDPHPEIDRPIGFRRRDEE